MTSAVFKLNSHVSPLNTVGRSLPFPNLYVGLSGDFDKHLLWRQMTTLQRREGGRESETVPAFFVIFFLM